MAEVPVEQCGNGRKTGIVLRFWGVTVELRGLTVIMSAVLLVVGLVLFGLFLHDRETSRDLKSLLVEQAATTQSMQEFTYVITLTQEKREALRLQMPTSLHKKLSQQQNQ